MGNDHTTDSSVPGAAGALQLVWARLLLVLVPLVAAGLLGDAAMRSRWEERRTAFIDEVSDRIERIAVRSDEDLAITQPLYALEQSRRSTGTVPEAEALAGELRQRVPGITFELFAFDAKGTLLGSVPSNAPNQWLMRRLLPGLIADERAAEAAGLDLDRKLKALFGNSRTLDSFRRGRGRAVRLQRMQQPVLLFWDSNARGGWMAIITSEPDLEMRLKRAWAEESAQGMALGWRASDSGRWKFFGEARPELAARFWKYLERQGRQGIDTNLRHWEFRLTNRGNILFLTVPLPASTALPPLSLWWGCILVVSLPIGYFALYGRDRLGPISRLSVLLFIIAAAVPTACAALGGVRVLADRREVLRGQVQRAQVETLRLFDERFADHLDRFKRRLIKNTSGEEFFGASSSTAEIAAPFLSSTYVGHLEMLGSDSRTVLRIPQAETAFTFLLPHIQRLGLKVLAPDLLATSSIAIDPGIEGLFRSDRFGFTALALRPRRMNQMNAGSNRPIFYWDYPRRRKAYATFASFIFKRENLMRDYVGSRILESGSLWGTKIRLGAHHLEQPEAFPENAGIWKKLTPALHKSQVLNKPVFGRVRSGGHDWWYTAFVGSNLDHYGLIALFPNNRIEHALDELRFRAFSGMAIMIALAAGLGTLLSRRLARPVSALAEGVDNLHHKIFNKPVHIDGQDELAKLSVTFNDMMAELKDLNVAKAVQTSLLPSSFPQPPGYSIHGQTLFAGDLGGDCLDCRAMPDGRILLLIGDVSGHGASSALLMAFIKATVTLWSHSGNADLRLLADRIDGLLRSFPGPKRFLAFFGCLLDPVTHTLQWLSGGHPFPVLLRPDHEPGFIGIPLYPLGIRRTRQSPPTGRITIEPGDTLFFYTDGLVEALDAAGQPFGYERMTAVATHARSEASADQFISRSIIDTVTKRHKEFCRVPDDDVTLMVLTRLPGKAERT